MRPRGFEPLAYDLGNRCSIHLSYGRTFNRGLQLKKASNQMMPALILLDTESIPFKSLALTLSTKYLLT